MMLPARECPTRTPMSRSGKITFEAPTRSRIFPWGSVTALATMRLTPRSTSADVVRMLASMSVPMATTAVPNSPAPIWRSASTSVESASTTWVSPSRNAWTSLGALSTRRPSCPRLMRVSASPPPKRPRPMTRNSFSRLANDRSLLRETVEPLPLSERERKRERIRAGAAEEHERDQDGLAEVVELGRDPGGQTDGAESREGLEERLLERERARGHERERAEHDGVEGDQGDAGGRPP